MAGQQSRRDKQRSAFGYVVGQFYFYGQKDWPGGTNYECRRHRQALYVRRHYMETELNKILKSYPTTVNHTDIIDFDNFDERLSAIDTIVVNTIGVSEDTIEFIPDNEPPLKEEIYCWIWAIRPDLSKDLLNLEINEDFRILLKSYIDNDMSKFWNHIS
jgi:hypothetical protein